jgi:hypothetical protein
VALSMDEQRILDEMERNLAADDPRLASRLGSFGQQRLPGSIRVQHARTIGGVLALALIAAVTVMMFVVSPFANHGRYGPAKTGPSHVATSQSAGTPKSTSPATASAGS